MFVGLKDWEKFENLYIYILYALNSNMLPKDLSKYTALQIEEGFKTLKAENDARMKPLLELLSKGEKLTPAEERLVDSSGNLIVEFKLVERIKETGDVACVASELTDAEKVTLEVLILKVDQKHLVDTSKALKCMFCRSTQNLKESQADHLCESLIYTKLNFNIR